MKGGKTLRDLLLCAHFDGYIFLKGCEAFFFFILFFHSGFDLLSGVRFEREIICLWETAFVFLTFESLKGFAFGGPCNFSLTFKEQLALQPEPANHRYTLLSCNLAQCDAVRERGAERNLSVGILHACASARVCACARVCVCVCVCVCVLACVRV